MDVVEVYRRYVELDIFIKRCENKRTENHTTSQKELLGDDSYEFGPVFLLLIDYIIESSESSSESESFSG